MQAWIPVVSSSLYFWKSVFSFRADSILKSDGDFISNWKFPDYVHFFGAWSRQAVIETIVVVYELPKRTQEKLLGTIMQSIFCAQSRASIRLNFWKYFFLREKPWGRGWDERSSRPKCEIIAWGAGGLYTFLIFFFFCHGSRFSPIKTTQKQTIMSCTWGISYLKLFWTSDIIDYLVLTSNRQHVTEKFPHVQTNQTKQLRWEFLIKTKCKSSLFNLARNLDSVQFWYELNRGGGGGGTPGDSCWGVCRPVLKILTLFQTK